MIKEWRGASITFFLNFIYFFFNPPETFSDFISFSFLVITLLAPSFSSCSLRLQIIYFVKAPPSLEAHYLVLVSFSFFRWVTSIVLSSTDSSVDPAIACQLSFSF